MSCGQQSLGAALLPGQAVSFGMGTALGLCGEAALQLGRGFCSPRGDTRSPLPTHPPPTTPTIVEVVVVPLQPWNQCWPMGIRSQEMGWGCADMGKDNPAPNCWQKP